MNNKRYLNISEAAKLLDIEEHKIRYWDSIDPKTNKLRIDGISTKSKGGTRYFNKENIQKLSQLKKILYDNKSAYKPLDLANKLLSNKKIINDDDFSINKYNFSNDDQKLKKIKQILKNIRNTID